MIASGSELVFLNCAFSLLEDCEFILAETARKLSFYYAAATKAVRNETLKRRWNIGGNTMNIKKSRYRTLDEVVEERFREHPEEVAGFLQTVLEEYEKDPDEGALLSALRQVAKANGGMTELARKTGLSRERLYKTLSPEGNPRLINLRRILQAFGYTLTFKPLKTVS